MHRGHLNYASIAQLAEHFLRKEKVTSSILVGGCLFAWSSWLRRSPHTREVLSSSLGANTSIFFSQKKTLNNKVKNHGKKTSFLPLHHAQLSHCLLLIQEALIMIQACIMCLPRIDWVWKFRIQVFSKLVESTNSSLGSKHTYSVPQTLLRFSNILCEQKKNKNNNKNLSENVVGK